MALIRTFTGHTAPVLAAVFMPGNRFILSASGDRTAKLWDPDQDEAVRTFDFPEPLTTLALRHDGLAVVGDKGGRVTLWDVTTGEIRTAVRGFGGAVRSLAACSDRDLVVAGGEVAGLMVCQGPLFENQRTILPAHTGSTNAVAVHPLHDIILSGGDDRQIKLWGTASDTPLHQFEARRPEQGAVLSLAISHDGHLALSGGHPSVKLWEIKSTRIGAAMTFTGRELGVLGTFGDISAVAFSGDDRFALSAELAKANLRRVDRENPEENLVTALEGHAARIRSVAFSSNDRLAVSASEDGTSGCGICRRCCRNRRHSDVSRDAVMTVVSSNSKWGSMLSLFLFAESGRPRSCWKWLP